MLDFELELSDARPGLPLFHTGHLLAQWPVCLHLLQTTVDRSCADEAALAFALALDLAVRIRVLADAELALALASFLLLGRPIVKVSAMLRDEDVLELEQSLAFSSWGTAHSGHQSRWCSPPQ